jgi:hypothetical protein
MHGLQTGAPMRRISLVGVFMLVMLALATHVTVARADTPPPNTITQTAITSPSDPSYYYDSTNGAYGGITVTGTTDSTDPSSDAVDIDCYVDNGTDVDSSYYSGGYYDEPAAPVVLAPDVPLDANGEFSTTVSYAAIEEDSYYQDGACQLRAVPTDTGPEAQAAPVSLLGSYTGPRVLVSYLSPDYDYEGSGLQDFGVTAPALGADDYYSSAGDCGIEDQALTSQTYFGESNDDSVQCSDSYEANSSLEVDGTPVYTEDDGEASPSVAVSQDPANGDLTISESEPLQACASDCDSLPIVDNRTVRQTDEGKVIVVTDDYTNTSDAEIDDVTDDIGTWVDLGDYSGDELEYDFPGTSGYLSYSYASEPSSAAAAPATIYAENADSSSEGFDAFTYFTTPSGPPVIDEYNEGEDNYLTVPYDFTIPANGSVSLSFAYSTEYNSDLFGGDLATALDLQSAPTVSITSPAVGSTTASSSVTVTGVATASTGVQSVSVNGVAATLNGGSFSAAVPLTQGSNTIQAMVTTDTGVTTSTSETVTYNPSGTLTGPTSTVAPALQAAWAGPIWDPIADTGAAKAANARKEKLGGHVTSGSAAVSYYFEYGTHGHLSHRSKTMRLGASKTSHAVALSIGGLSAGTRYAYRLVASGRYGHSAGASRTFKVAKRGN